MTNIIIPGKDRDFGKHCSDWRPLKDGTLTGDTIYCDHSLGCKQNDAYARGYVSHWYKFRDMETGEDLFDYFCTGMHPVEVDEGREDKEVS